MSKYILEARKLRRTRQTLKLFAGTLLVLLLIALALTISRLYMGWATRGLSLTGLELGLPGFLSGTWHAFLSALFESAVLPASIAYVVGAGILVGRAPWGRVRISLILVGLSLSLAAASTAKEFTIEFIAAFLLASLLAPTVLRLWSSRNGIEKNPRERTQIGPAN